MIWLNHSRSNNYSFFQSVLRIKMLSKFNLENMKLHEIRPIFVENRTLNANCDPSDLEKC